MTDEKITEVTEAPKKKRGRPRKDAPVVDVQAPKKKRGRPRKDSTEIVKAKSNKKLEIKIKYFSDDLIPIEKIVIGDWIDLRSAKTIQIAPFTFKLIPLGVAMELPKGYEAHIVPRSSTFKKFHIIQTNSQGIIDNSYCGDEDQWYFPAHTLNKPAVIEQNDRICQFRIVPIQPEVIFTKCSTLGNKNRGGFGTTGKK